MQLGQLYENFGLLSPELQAKYVAEYRLRRAIDLEKPSSLKKKKAPISAKEKKASLVLTAEEKQLMKVLGIKQKDIIALRELAASDDEIEDNGSLLLEDSTYDEGESE